MSEWSQSERELFQQAREALKQAYVPYSDYPVGAAVRTGEGRVHRGCNVENASYGLTVCAERIAIFKAVSEGEVKLEALAVVIEGDKQLATPCGACRQVMEEFNETMTVIRGNTAGEFTRTSLDVLLPEPFRPPGTTNS